MIVIVASIKIVDRRRHLTKKISQSFPDYTFSGLEAAARLYLCVGEENKQTTMAADKPLLSRVSTSNPDAISAIDRTVPEFPAATPIDEDNYFRLNKPPPYLSQISKDVADFINCNHLNKKKIVLVTSGGTTVPLENNTVRFIDNFSAGTRGATSAEYFLDNDKYSVIFLHREFSLLPYSRHFSHHTNTSLLDHLNFNEVGDKIEVDDLLQNELFKVLKKYQQIKKQNRLLLIPFTTVHQYLFTLKLIAQELSVIGSDALFYLAAAVSDFFLPNSRIPEHKIQSNTDQGGNGKLVVDLEPVPKFLRRLVDSWAPISMIVSFKLETDNNILIKKARNALERYNHQLVIGNLLQNRKKEVVFVTPEVEEWIKLSDNDVMNKTDIESLIIPKIIDMHLSWIENHESIN